MIVQEPIEIKSFEDLQNARQFLKARITEQENMLRNNPVVKITTKLFGENSIKNSFKHSIKNPISSFSKGNLIKTAENLLSTFLLANKKTRSFYIGYSVVKEMIPFTMQKINELLKK